MTHEVVHIYRALYRAVPHAVRHHKAASKNLRRLLRSDFDESLAKGVSGSKLAEQSSKTLFLYLASSQHGQVTRNGASFLSHKVVSNIASLCYHHLSPYTHMQPFTKQRRAGGTDTSSLRRRRSAPTKSKAVSGLDSFETDDSFSLAASDVAQGVLPSLAVTAKPIRGPIIPSAMRQYLPARWDGQRPVPSIESSPAYIAHLTSVVEGSMQRLLNAKEHYGPDSSQYEKLRAQYRKEKGDLKSATQKRSKEVERHVLQQQSANMLQEVVQQAQTNTRCFLGASRFTKWRNGQWLG